MKAEKRTRETIVCNNNSLLKQIDFIPNTYSNSSFRAPSLLFLLSLYLLFSLFPKLFLAITTQSTRKIDILTILTACYVREEIWHENKSYHVFVFLFFHFEKESLQLKRTALRGNARMIITENINTLESLLSP